MARRSEHLRHRLTCSFHSSRVSAAGATAPALVGSAAGCTDPAPRPRAVTASTTTGKRAIAVEANRRLWDNNPLGMFVTGVLFMLDPVDRFLHHVCVGHDPPVVLSPGGRPRHLPGVSPVALPFGVQPDTGYEVTTTVLAPGEVVVAYTDGVTDGVDSAGEAFGEARLRDLLGSLPDTVAPADVLDAVWTATDRYSLNAPVVDDRTMLVVSSVARDAGAEPS